MERARNYLIAASWFLFLLVVVLMDAAWSAPIHVLKAAIGLIGIAVSLALLYRQRAWTLTASAMLAATVVLVYAAELLFRVSSYRAADPEAGWLTTLWLKLWTSYAAPLKLAHEGSVGRAIGELYWNLGMPLVQIIILPVLVFQYRIKRDSQRALS